MQSLKQQDDMFCASLLIKFQKLEVYGWVNKMGGHSVINLVLKPPKFRTCKNEIKGSGQEYGEIWTTCMYRNEQLVVFLYPSIDTL